MEELAPKAKEAGYRLALNEINLPGYGFQYLCNILDTGYLSTLDGRKWQKDFLNGDTTLQGNADMMKDLQLLQRWRDIGMLNGEMQKVEDGMVVDEMVKGNTLFLLGTTNSIEEHGGNVEDYGLMPYLSEDGSQNVYILNVTRYMGLSKKLEEPGNEQKLEDALHVMEVLSTREGIEALNSNFITTNISPLKDTPNIEGNFYNDILDEINAGYVAPFIYAGWENAIVTYGNEMLDFICGDAELSDVAACIDENQHLITDKAPAFTTVTETIPTEGCAKLVGIAFTQATNADLALISIGGWDPETGATNGEGVNGQLFPMDITEQEVCIITPTGWNGTIQTVTLSGKRIKELAETGYDRKDRGYCYPYLLIAKDGTELDDDTIYTVAICGTTESLREEGNIQDTGVHGLTAVEDYLSKFDTLTEADIDWE
ncbi:extracellular solute-binding protein [Gemmiger sp.]